MNKNIVLRSLSVVVAAVSLVGCANRGGGPQGGPKDVAAPVPQLFVPADGAVGVKSRKMTLAFDEFVQVKDVQQNVVVSPPQRVAPSIVANGKKVNITFNDSLQPNTTYTVDFGNSLQDLNESNPLDNFTYSFSTGQTIDSMRLSGHVIDAATLAPCVRMLVALYDASVVPNKGRAVAKADSLGPRYQMPVRITRTDSTGYFCVKNVKAGNYRVYAFDDKNSDYMAGKFETFAFVDTAYATTSVLKERIDSLKVDTTLNTLTEKQLKKLARKRYKWKLKGDTAALRIDSARFKDTVIHVVYPDFSPSDILLRASAPFRLTQKMKKMERKSKRELQLIMQMPFDSAVGLRCLSNPDAQLLRNFSRLNDTINVWLADSVTANQDTVRLALTYFTLNDSTDELYQKTDTLKSVFRKRNAAGNDRKKEKNGLAMSIPQAVPYFSPVALTFSSPVVSYDTSLVSVLVMKDDDELPPAGKDSAGAVIPVPDSLKWKPVAVDSIIPIRYRCTEHQNAMKGVNICFKIDPGREYKLHLDSAFAVSFDSLASDRKESTLKIISPERFSALSVKLMNATPDMILRVLDDKENVVREVSLRDSVNVASGINFEHMPAGDFYLCAFNDADGDGKWTTGDWTKNRQPELMTYMNEKIHLRPNWTVEQTWDLKAVAPLRQRPVFEQKK